MTVDNLPPRPPTAFRSVGILCNSFGDPYTVPILHGAAKELSAQGYHTICLTGGFPNAPIYQGIDQQPAIPPFLDGLILLSATMRGFGSELEQMASGSPQAVVSIGASLGQLPSIAANDETGIFQAVAHLVKRHDRKLIAFIGGPEGSTDGSRRQAAYRIALENFNLPCDPSLVVRGDYEARSGREAVRALRQMSSKSFDAIVAANDLMAIGAMEGLQAAGIRVPGKVSVIGFDDMEEAAFTVPSLTTVRQPVYEQGISAAHLVLRLLKGGTIEDQVTIIPTPLVLRHSCGCATSDSGQRMAAVVATDMLESYEKLEDAMRSRIRRHLAAQRQHRELSRLADRLVSVVDFPELASVMSEVFR
ncbi:MAG TPA: substrate-binding domain-containing protein, partial [Polyangiaceae bacterium]|nr:substrate-binding domain-containing protein [Polyangiaceae bacterium]